MAGQGGIRVRAIASALALIVTAAVVGVISSSGAANTAPGPKDRGANWTTGNKEGVGTSATPSSPVWYTLARGVLTDVFFPTLDYSNVQDMQFVIVDPTSRAELERDATTHRVEQPDPRAPIFRQVNEKPGRYRITKTYVTDPARPTLLIDVGFESLDGATYSLYVLYNPSLGNSALHDSGRTDAQGGGLAASDGRFASYLRPSGGASFARMSNGFSDNNDGWTDLSADGRMDYAFDEADDGNLVQTAELRPLSGTGPSYRFSLALAFGATVDEAKGNAAATVANSGGFAAVQGDYASEWHRYLSDLTPPPASVSGDPRLTQVYLNSLMVLHANEDKVNRGAQVAALATPWGDLKQEQAREDTIRDYHAVWSRDSYEQATGLLAGGDRAQAERILTFLLTRQQIRTGPEAGEFPRFSKTDGSDLGGDHQLDEAAYPVILAWQLGHRDAATWSEIERIANRIATVGPSTKRERWEEQGGLSPSTIASGIAALVCAGDMARAQGQVATAGRWEQTADQWRQALPTWTLVTRGPLGDGKYYERIEDASNPDPNDDDQRDWGRSQAKEKEVVDGGFLEQVRLGVRTPKEATVVDSLPELDSKTAVDLPGGRFYHRYNRGLDAYGEEPSGRGWTPGDRQGLGRPWPLLGGERGEYELAAGDRAGAEAALRTMATAVNQANLLPEQVWDSPDVPSEGLYRNRPTNSATPLGWAAGQFVRLAQSISAAGLVDTPSVVATRYAQTP